MNIHLELTYDRIDAVGDAVSFRFRLKNEPEAHVRILGFHWEFWQTSDTSGNRERRIGQLQLDAQSIICGLSQDEMKLTLKPGEDTPLQLFWPTTPDALQQIEDHRTGLSPVFRIRPLLLVDAIWPTQQAPREKWRTFYGWEGPRCGNGWPMWVTVPDREWIKVLDRLKFKHNTLDRLKWPALPPAFARSEEHLAAAWHYHRTGDFDAALNSCYKAFDCLGFNLTGEKVERKELLDTLMEKAEEEKRQALIQLLKALTNVFHLGRHEGRAPVKVTYGDSQLAVTAATVALSYLATVR